MKVLLEGLLPRLFPGLAILCIAHEGKQDLEKSIPRKLRAWYVPEDVFVVVRDNDGGDCRALKQHLVEEVKAAGRADTLVRIACQELEAWYFGDPDALATAYDRDDLRSLAAKAPYRDPDGIQQPASKLAELIDGFQKLSGARALARLLRRENRSRSYQAFMAGVERLGAS